MVPLLSDGVEVTAGDKRVQGFLTHVGCGEGDDPFVLSFAAILAVLLACIRGANPVRNFNVAFGFRVTFKTRPIKEAKHRASIGLMILGQPSILV
jgi:hypothetical protein